MRRTLLIIVAVATLAASGWAAHAATTHPTPAAPQPADPRIGSSAPTAQLAQTRHAATDHPTLATQLATARLATGRYALNLGAAHHDRYQRITRMLPDMGWHFLNPTIHGFDVRKPHILVSQRHHHSWQLGALEWVFTQTPATPGLDHIGDKPGTRAHAGSGPGLRARTVPSRSPACTHVNCGVGPCGTAPAVSAGRPPAAGGWPA
jgi:hypothetical protein